MDNFNLKQYLVENKITSNSRMLQTVTEGAEDDLADIFYEYLNDVRQFTGVTSFETCDEDDWDKVKDYIEKDKKNFLNQHPKIQETNFDEYVENWIDRIEDQRGFESINRRDLNYGHYGY